MKDLILNDFTVLSNGKAFASQRKTAELCGVSQSAISQFCLSKKIDVSQGVSSENLTLLITHYCHKGKQEAIDTLILFAQAGSKAYIYEQAGYKFTVTRIAPPPPRLTAPTTYIEALQALIVKEELLIAEQKAHQQTNILLIETDEKLETATVQLDESKKYFSIKRVALNNGKSWKHYSWFKLKATGGDVIKIFDANYGNVNAYHITAWALAYPDAVLPL